jgi:hypothetical protein
LFRAYLPARPHHAAAARQLILVRLRTRQLVSNLAQTINNSQEYNHDQDDRPYYAGEETCKTPIEYFIAVDEPDILVSIAPMRANTIKPMP